MEPTNLPDAQLCRESQMTSGVGEPNLPQPIMRSNARIRAAAAPNFPDAHTAVDSQPGNGVGDSNLPQPTVHAKTRPTPAAAPNLPDAQDGRASQRCFGVGDQTTDGAQAGHVSHVVSGALGPILRDPTLALCADVVDDLERVKIANQNRLRQLTRPFEEIDSDGEQRGHGLTVDHPDVARLAAIVDAITAAEHQAVLNLQRVMRKHPLGPFVKNSKGIGEKQAARLLASIGDPYWNDLHGRPRRLRELYRFCGMDVVGTSAQGRGDSHMNTGVGVAPTKQRGERVHWNPDARMRLWLIASKCVMVGHGGPYRAIYDAGRAKYADAVHTTECRRCGPKGKPAQPGTPLSAGHQNARAVRLIAKAILRDLWTEAKNIHEQKASEQ